MSNWKKQKLFSAGIVCCERQALRQKKVLTVSITDFFQQWLFLRLLQYVRYGLIFCFKVYVFHGLDKTQQSSILLKLKVLFTLFLLTQLTKKLYQETNSKIFSVCSTSRKVFARNGKTL